MVRYEWLYDDARLVIYDLMIIVEMLTPGVQDPFELWGHRKECLDQFPGLMKEQNITAVKVDSIPRTVNGALQRGYWVLSFSDPKHVTMFKLRYGML